ncbi:MAG: M15 family metallopeptidase [Polyangiaceae bacterium]
MLRRSLLLLPLLAACGGEAAPREHVGHGGLAISVEEAVAAGCSTLQVEALSAQVLGQVECNAPGTFTRLSPGADVSLAASVIPYLQTDAVTALESALAATPGEPIQINGMLRSLPQQLLLYRWFTSGSCAVIGASAPGSGSGHEEGIAIDVEQHEAWADALTAAGFAAGGGESAVHFEYGAGADLGGAVVLAFQQLWNLNNPSDVIAEDGLYGPQTEGRLEMSPAEGFATGPSCGPLDLGGDVTIDLAFADASDRFDDGPSAGAIDLVLGETYALDVTVTAEAAVAGAVLELDFPGAALPRDVDGEAVSSPSLDVDLGDLAAGASRTLSITVEAVGTNVDDPTPAPLTARLGQETEALGLDVYSSRRWAFESARTEGWNGVDGSDVVSEDGALVLTGSGELVAESPTVAVPADEIRAIVVEAALGDASEAALWWATEATPDFDASRSLALDASLFVGGAAETLRIEGADMPAIEGTLRQLRLVVKGSASARLAYLELSGSGEGPPLPDPETNGDDEGGCGCRMVGTSPPSTGWLLLLGLAFLRRRR